jgi:hypothetical protein
MDRKELSEALLGFYDKIGQNPEHPLYPGDFTLIGGSSLVLQDVISDASDVDLITGTSLGEIMEFNPDLIRLPYYLEPGRPASVINFDFEGQLFSIIAWGEAMSLLDGRLRKRKRMRMGGMKIYVRPARLIAEDYRKALGEMHPPLQEDKIEKYEGRLRLISMHSAQLYK